MLFFSPQHQEGWESHHLTFSKSNISKNGMQSKYGLSLEYTISISVKCLLIKPANSRKGISFQYTTAILAELGAKPAHASNNLFNTDNVDLIQAQ